jgi:folate-dependent tRNA-U54 methylase TrmFO/GidA
LPKELVNREKLDRKVCRQYALEEFAENLILIDTGHAKLMTSYFDLEDLRSIKGFENARYIDPYAASKSNSVRYMAVGIRNDYMQAEGMRNLFLAGEKSGFFVGHTEAISTGSLAGYNGARMASGKTLLKIPNTLSIGDLIEFSNEVVINERDTSRRFTFAGGEYFQRMKSKGIYTTDKEKIRREVEAEGLLDIYNHSYDVIE